MRMCVDLEENMNADSSFRQTHNKNGMVCIAEGRGRVTLGRQTARNPSRGVPIFIAGSEDWESWSCQLIFLARGLLSLCQKQRPCASMMRVLPLVPLPEGLSRSKLREQSLQHYGNRVHDITVQTYAEALLLGESCRVVDHTPTTIKHEL